MDITACVSYIKILHKITNKNANTLLHYFPKTKTVVYR